MESIAETDFRFRPQERTSITLTTKNDGGNWGSWRDQMEAGIGRTLSGSGEGAERDRTSGEVSQRQR